MNILLVIAHPEKKSFNHALFQTAAKELPDLGHSVQVSDLYQEKFTPSAGPEDMSGYPDEDSFQLAQAQRWAQANDAFVDAITTEQKKLLDSDLVILQFPIWWGSYPAILKGWIDRVLSSGFAYGRKPRLPPKEVMFSVTTGGASDAEEEEYYRTKVEGLFQDVFGFMGWTALPPFMAHGAARIDRQAREALLADYGRHLRDNL